MRLSGTARQRKPVSPTGFTPFNTINLSKGVNKVKAYPRDVEVATMKVRHIGIESELLVGERNVLPRGVSAALKKRGILRDAGWDCGAREFRTNPISIRSLYQVRGQKYLGEYYDTLKNVTRVRDGNGTHIHISILNTDHPNMEANATAIATAFHEQFQKVAGRQTHWANRLPCTSVEEAQRCIRRNRLRNQPGRVYGRMTTMLGPTRYQTLEFRGPKGSNNKAEVLAWIEFLENIVKAANRENVKDIQFSSLLKGERIGAYAKSLRGWRVLTKEDLCKTFNGANLRA